ncbi:hypothetical protein M1494_00655 [Candidatus Parvarchaeota archaeon]|nr:hypothetical protein [Candidatus Parvarchaeota archaeon]
MRKKKSNKIIFGSVKKLISRKYIIIEVLSFLSLFIFSVLVFNYLKNWDMFVRILNARHIFFNGYYYEPMRALFESFVIGVFMFVSKSYAVYIFIFFVSVVFFIAVYSLSKALKLNFPFLFLFTLSPFVLFYGIKNGSDLLVIAFLLIYITAILKDKPILAGVFLSLAFVSKSYALLFSPLLLFFLWNRNLKGVLKLLVSVVFAALALIPYFIYNFLAYGNFLYSIGLSYLYFHIFSSYISLSLSISHIMNIPLIGFIELLLPAALLVFFFIYDRKHFIEKIKKHEKEYAMITVACILSFLTYFSVANLLAITGLSIFRFMLPLSIFMYILAFSFFTEKHMKLVYVFFALSFLIALILLYSSSLYAFHLSYASSAVSLFTSVYNSSSCTVSSNEWVYLDYLGLNAVPPLSSYVNYTGVILNFGPVNTTLPLVKNSGNIYLYGYSKCGYYPSLNESRAYYVMEEEGIPNNACYWLFGINPKLGFGYDSCISINNAFYGVFR